MSAMCHWGFDFKYFLQEFVAAKSTVKKYCLLLLQKLMQSAFLFSLVWVKEFWGLSFSEKHTYWWILDWYVMTESRRKTNLKYFYKKVNCGLEKYLSIKYFIYRV